jgi:hypothetical protein
LRIFLKVFAEGKKEKKGISKINERKAGFVKKLQRNAIAMGAGVAALAATAAAAYFLTGKNGPKNRKKVGAWVAKMQKDVIGQLKKARQISEGKYHEIIDSVHESYKAMENVDTKELSKAAVEMKKHWSKIQAEIEKAAKAARKIPQAAKKTIRSASRARSRK